MPFPSVEEFKSALATTPLESAVRTYIFEGIPYAFQENPNALKILVEHLGKNLGVEENSFTIIGSAKIGFSLSPDNFPRQFSDESDVDVLVVSQELFDQFWQSMLRWNYPRRYRLVGADWK